MKPLWKFCSSSVLSPLPPLWSRRHDLGGTVLRVAAVELPPFVFWDEEEGTHGGSFVEILSDLEEALNFRAELAFPADGKFGSEDRDSGRWNGAIGEVLEGRADLTSSAAMSVERLEVVDFAFTLTAIHATVLTAGGHGAMSVNLNVTAFLNIFDPTVWAVLASLLLTVAALFALLDGISDGLDWGRALADGLFSSTVLAIQQGSDDVDRWCGADKDKDGQKKIPLLSFRTTFLSASLCLYLVFALYTSDLTATMTAGSPPHRQGGS